MWVGCVCVCVCLRACVCTPVSCAVLPSQLQHNIQWGQLSNLASIPSDCPQRDERKGWMGDAGITADECMYNFDTGQQLPLPAHVASMDVRGDLAAPWTPSHGADPPALLCSCCSCVLHQLP
jgi:hypothetical protein